MNDSQKNEYDPFGNDPRILALSEKIMTLRLEQKISQADLAERAGVPQSQISKIERGIVAEPGIWTLLNIATALNTTVEDLLLEEKTKKKLQNLDWDLIKKGTPLVISVTSPKGGSGKSSTAVNLAAHIAHKKSQDDSSPRVLVIDGDVVDGTLKIRYRSREPRWAHGMISSAGPIVSTAFGMMELMNLLDDDKAPDTFEGLVNHGLEYNQGISILMGFDYRDATEDMTHEDYETILNYMGQFFDVIIIDCGVDMWANYQRVWMQRADAVLLLSGYPEPMNVQRMIKYLKYWKKSGIDITKFIPLTIAPEHEKKHNGELLDHIRKMFPVLVEMHDLRKSVDGANNAGDFLALLKTKDARRYRQDMDQLMVQVIRILKRKELDS